ncbi:putative leucine-rich repeat-containing protein DDB_G0290503 [Clytia hemisphaerica]|uniref:putative leucine-rich repeat-containing protein DDB_G0290503 n=1 Tax=Clytia hemisphaerica TaxID=252671 RepID=UPI0034D51057
MEVEKLKSKLLNSEERDKTLKATVEKLEKKGHDDRSKILNFEKEVNSLKQRIKTLKQENSSLSDNVKSMESQMKEELSSKVIENERLSHETKQVREELQCKIDQLETDHLSYTVESEAVEVENLKKQNISLNEKLTSSDVKLENLSQNYEDLSKDLQCSRKENESLQIEIEEREKVILELKSRIKQHENEAMDLKEKQTNNMSLIDQLNQQSKSELAAQKSVYDEKLTVLEADYELLKTSLRNCEQEKSVCIETYKKQIKTLQLQSDGEIDRMSHERDELSTTLQTAHLDLNEYKIKFNSLENELEEVSMVNADLKQNLSLLSKELETYQSENQNNFDKDEEINELREIILSLRKREEEMARIISKNKTEKTCLDENLTVLRQENEGLKAGKNTMQQDWDMNRNELLVKIETVTKQQNDLQNERNETNS